MSAEFLSKSLAPDGFDRYEHNAKQTRPKFPFHRKEWKMPGWTGHNMQESEVFGNTPIYQQKNVVQPLNTSTLMAPRVDPVIDNQSVFKDVCSNSKNWLRDPPDNLFPDQILKPAEKGTPPFTSSITVGDARYHKAVKGFTGYTTTYHELCDSLNSSVKANRVIHATPDFEDLQNMAPEAVKEIYKKNSERVSAEIVTVIRNTMRTRIMGKIKPGNNSSTFTLRMLFKYVDTNHYHGRGDGRLNMNDFSEMLMMFGMQLNKTDTAAIFAYYDKEFMGSVDIDMFMKDMVDEDYYAMFSRDRHTEKEYHQKFTDIDLQKRRDLKDKWMLDRYELLKAFKKVSGSKVGLVDEKELLYVLAKFEVYPNPEELEFLRKDVDHKDKVLIDSNAFVNKYAYDKLLASASMKR